MKWEVLEHYVSGGKVRQPVWMSTDYINLVNGAAVWRDGREFVCSEGYDTNDWEIWQEPKSQAIRRLEAGEKLRYPGWTEKAYIYMKDGHIVWCDDNGGGKYEWASGLEEHDDWQIWKSPTLTPVEAMRALLNGEKVRQVTWHDGCYRNIVGGQVVNRKGNPASPAIYRGIKYETYQPPTKCKTCGK